MLNNKKSEMNWLAFAIIYVPIFCLIWFIMGSLGVGKLTFFQKIGLTVGGGAVTYFIIAAKSQ